MNKIAIITSVDYELFGDGSGNVDREQVIPTNNLVKIANQYGVKLTIMFEYGQYLAYEKFANDNVQFKENNKKIVNQLIALVKEGHDVQLHYHAQWENAFYDIKEQKFKLNLNKVDFSSLDYGRIVDILKQGKQFLDKLLKSYNNNYQCIGFRSGSWAVKDQKKLLQALKEAGFKSDSSVVPNTKFKSEQVNFEYKNCPYQCHYWFVDEFLEKAELANKNFLEIPIYTKKNIFSFFKYMNKKYFISRNVVSKLYKVKISEKNFSFIQKIKKILSRNYYMADLNTMSAKTLIHMVEEALNDDQFTNEKIIPIMFISHSKTSYALDDLHTFYTYLNIHYPDEIEYWTYQEAIEYILKDKND